MNPSKRKSALIVGCTGQDGVLLSEYLKGLKYDIIGIDRTGVLHSETSLDDKRLAVFSEDDVQGFIRETRPDEIYYLAAFHHSSEETQPEAIELFSKSHEVHVAGYLNFLAAIHQTSPETRILYAASSHIFGSPVTELCSETTPFNPVSPYGITKLAGLMTGRFFRRDFGVFASAGILFPHESSLRKPTFLSRRIVKTAVDIKRGLQSELKIGNLQASSDWGYAPDYIRAMHGILNAADPDDFVVATGVLHTVQQFVEITFDSLELDWKRYVIEDETTLVRKSRSFAGNATKLMERTGWKPSISFEEMVRLLVREVVHAG
ncbi:MAG: GDP-mannose 4,6-dehydratase [Bacteroidetes bacterium]|nr:GDP-mannose 4,6-dehydratase [Bacteroidota bacterium]